MNTKRFKNVEQIKQEFDVMIKDLADQEKKEISKLKERFKKAKSDLLNIQEKTIIAYELDN